MKNHFAQYLSEENWLMREDGWDSRRQEVRESLFTLGNGYISSRGVLEENPYDSHAGTYIAGIFDNTGAQVTELVNLPNPLDFKIVCQGEKLDVKSMDVLEHKRTLDMKKGILARHTIYSSAKKKRFSYQSLRFFSIQDKHVGAMRIYLTPLDGSTVFTVQTGVDTSVTNKGVLTEGRKKHFQITEVSSSGNTSYTEVQTFQHNIYIAYGTHLLVSRKNSHFTPPKSTFSVRAKKGETICLTKTFSVYTSRRVSASNLKETAIKAVRRHQSRFESLLARHIAAWERRWDAADITIKKDPSVEKALRFNIYHMIICGPDREGQSIGARTLSGDGYRGHIFWDTEIFMLPFYIFAFPKIARNILLYRYYRLHQAKKLAEQTGFKGARFPWESADSGEECTPSWAKDLDGSIIQISTMLWEVHIVSDVAYSFASYYEATQEEDFLLHYAAEILFETAKFWTSRVEYDNAKKKYRIRHVTGPDEFHEDVSDNTFTNIMARSNLLRAYGAYTRLKARFPGVLKRLLKKTKIKESEIKKWRKVASRIFVPYSKRKKIPEEFEGYFRKKDVPIKEPDNNFLPVFPKGVTPRNIGKTQLVKQADMVMLLFLLPDLFSKSEKKKIFKYYEKRTTHKSSLSASVHAAVAAEIGEKDTAFRYFFNALTADLRDTHGNTHEGMHAANLGGVWQAAIKGFAGVRIYKNTLSIDPNLPDRWQEMAFRLKWHGCNLDITVAHNRVWITCYLRKGKDKIFVRVFGVPQRLEPNKKMEFRRERKSRKRGG